MESVQRYKFDQLRWVNSYNDWAPVANQAHMAQAELVECASLMGYDTAKDKDSAAFVLGLENSLDMANQLVDAKMLGDGKKQSWGTRNDDPSATSKAQPELKGEQLTPKLGGVADAYRELQVAHHGIYKGLLNDQKHALEAESGAVTGEINEINEVIEFWAGMGEFAQGSYKKVGSAQKLAKKADDHYKNGDPHAKKELKQAQKDAHKAERDPSNYEHDINSHAHHGNYEDHYDTWGKGGAEKVKEGQEAKDKGDIEVAGAGEQREPSEAAEGMPELSVGGIIKMGLTAMNQKKLDELKDRLANLNGKTTATRHTIDLVESISASNAYQNALTKLDNEMKKLGEQSMRDREQDMLATGRDLDSYALEHRDELAKQHAEGLVPGHGKEIYATALACVAKVEKYQAMSKLALKMFPYNEFIAGISKDARERANHVRPEESASRSYDKTGHPPPAIPSFTDEEQAIYLQIAGAYKGVLEVDTHWSVRLEGVVERFKLLMKKLSGNAGVQGAVGKQF
ncbi:MAG: hypothetical protein JO257_31255 [Deltaproteobacteria bacterium]|nr:hypothetical protein [Deltaproteobacteria bacterium]